MLVCYYNISRAYNDMLQTVAGWGNTGTGPVHRRKDEGKASEWRERISLLEHELQHGSVGIVFRTASRGPLLTKVWGTRYDGTYCQPC